MESVINFFKSIVPEGFEIDVFLKAALFLIAGIVVLGVLGRLIFGKGSVLNRSISSAISILFIYAITIVIHSLGADLEFLLSPLPFIQINGDFLRFMIYDTNAYPQICNQLLTMIILAFVANLADSWLPKGKNIFSWFFFRCLSVIIAMVLHLIANAILTAFLPEGLLTWAPVVLLGLLLLLLFVGSLKWLIGVVLSLTVNPLIGALYTFFFANVVGKQISKAVLTTAILVGIVALLHYLGIAAIYIASSALAVYIPFLAILLLLWYLAGRIF